MDYKEKYEQALAKAKEILEYYKRPEYEEVLVYAKEDLTCIFPELKESDDERIRKHLIGVVELYYGNTDEQEKKDCLAWLEKREIKEHDVCDTCDEKASCVNPCPMKLIEEQKPAWSEEDESRVSRITEIVRNSMSGTPDDISWLKSLKYRMQPKLEWSEDDEYCRHQLIVFCENCMQQDSGAIRCADWLKSLRPQSQWKPMEDDVDRAISIMEKAAEDIEIPEKYKDSAWLSAAGEEFFRDLHRQLRDNILKAKEEAKNKI